MEAQEPSLQAGPKHSLLPEHQRQKPERRWAQSGWPTGPGSAGLEVSPPQGAEGRLRGLGNLGFPGLGHTAGNLPE